MSREDLHKLLGGYATGNLTAEEQQALFEAALNDQELFDELAREQSLRDLLRDPAAKAGLLAALDERPARWYQRLGGWRPALAVAGCAAMVVVAVLLVRHERPHPAVQLAEVRPSPAVPSAASRPYELDQAIPSPKQKPVAERRRATSRAASEPVAPSSPPAVVNGPASSASANGLRDASGGVVGGVPGGVVGGIIGAKPQPAPPPPATQDKEEAKQHDARQTVQVQATVGSLAVVSGSNARALFYDRLGASQVVAPRDAKEPANAAASQSRDTPQPAQQSQQGQQGQQGGQQQKVQNQALTMTRVAAQALQSPPANPGVRYKVQPPADDGTVRLELTPNDTGMLTVSGNGRTLLSRSVAPMETYTTEPLSPRAQELTVVFSRLNPVVRTAAGRGGAGVALKKDALRREDGADGTYVVGEPGAPQVSFTISLPNK